MHADPGRRIVGGLTSKLLLNSNCCRSSRNLLVMGVFLHVQLCQTSGFCCGCRAIYVEFIGLVGLVGLVGLFVCWLVSGTLKVVFVRLDGFDHPREDRWSPCPLCWRQIIQLSNAFGSPSFCCSAFWQTFTFWQRMCHWKTLVVFVCVTQVIMPRCLVVVFIDCQGIIVEVG